MLINDINDTIAAIATAYGEGGIGIIRISGPKSKSIIEKIFVSGNSKSGNISYEPVNRRMTYGRIVDFAKGKVIDEALSVYMKGPHTYTGEDVVEINCHGSMVSLKNTLSLVLSQGARMAEPGEFTKRAFLNGRMDLSQAEAVIDVIKAKTDKSFDIAISQLEGRLSKVIEKMRKDILDILVDITVNIDYPDEDIEYITYEKLARGIQNVKSEIEKLLSTSNSGRIIREGLRVAIVGKPNVGKSSLMNSLLRESRAIVTDIPGTTRDTIEENLSIRNIPINLIDTAGIRRTDDTVEKIGIERSKDAFNRSDFIFFIVDGSEPLTEEDEEIISYIDNRRALVLINKADKGNVVKTGFFKERLPNCDVIITSLIKDDGVTEIENIIESLVYDGKISQEESLIINNVRHEELLRLSLEALQDSYEAVSINEALDFVEIDIKNAYDYLGEIVGETVNDNILNEVFSRFCLGK